MSPAVPAGAVVAGSEPRRPAASIWVRRSLACGLVAAVAQLAAAAFVLVFFATTHPPLDASPAHAARAFADNAGKVAIGTWLSVLHLPFWLIFLAGLDAVLREAEDDDGGVLAGVAQAAGVTLVAITAIGALLSAITPTIAQLGGDEAVVKAVDGYTPLALALAGFPRAVLLVAVAVLMQRSRIPGARWTTWTGFGLAAVSLASTATLLTPALFPLAAFGALLFAVWIGAVAIVLATSTIPVRDPARARPRRAAAYRRLLFDEVR